MGKNKKGGQKGRAPYPVRADRSLGQNFLTDPAAAEAIVRACGAGKEDLVVEIGPGTGAVTGLLAQAAGKVAAVEIDERLIPVLRASLFGCENVEIINEDILKLDWDALLERKRPFGKLFVVGNLPYYITTPILLGLIEKNVPAESFTVMVQKEVAEKILAAPGEKEHGVLAALLQYYTEPELIADVPASSFSPAPKVDSAVVLLRERKERTPVKSGSAFNALVKAAFSQRRKTLLNSLSGYEGHSRDSLSAILPELGIDPLRRAETLTSEEFASLSNRLSL